MDASVTNARATESDRRRDERAATAKRRRGISFEDMAASRQERLINLVICLLSSRQFLSAERIRTTVPGYRDIDGGTSDDEAFKRKFERDKSTLRDLGVPLEVGPTSDGEDGYRIPENDYELPPIEFDAAEIAVIGLAARFWQSAMLAEDANTALLKLRAAGIEVNTPATAAVPDIDGRDANLALLLDAASLAQAVTFPYRKAGSAVVEERTIEPWGLPYWHNRWYVVGLDRGREQPRSFRLSRFEGAAKTVGAPGAFIRPDDVDLVGLVAGREPDQTSTARIRVSGAGAGQLRRLADSEGDGVLTIRYTDLSTLARQVASAGRSAHVLEPAELISAVRTRLLVAAGASA